MTAPDKQKNLTQVIYGLYAVSLLLGVTGIVAIVINYLKRDEVRGSWLESHFTWQIRTFWWCVLWAVVGWITFLLLIGWLVWGVAYVWFIYRIARGWLNLNDGKPMPLG